jgi:hypothetical protein
LWRGLSPFFAVSFRSYFLSLRSHYISPLNDYSNAFNHYLRARSSTEEQLLESRREGRKQKGWKLRQAKLPSFPAPRAAMPRLQ